MSNTSATPKQAAPIGPYRAAAEAGGLVFVSGQIPLDPATGELVSTDIRAAAEQVLKNLRTVLEAAGLDLASVVKTTVYLADMADFAAVNEVYARAFKPPYPARACVQVAALPRGARVEIDAIASRAKPATA